MCQCFFDLIDQDQIQVVGLQVCQCFVDGEEFVVNFFNVVGMWCVFKVFVEQVDDFVIFVVVLVGIFVEYYVVEVLVDDLVLYYDVFVVMIVCIVDDNGVFFCWYYC